MLNCVNIQGRLTDHPELIHTPGGNAVIDLPLLLRVAETVTVQDELILSKSLRGTLWQNSSASILKKGSKLSSRAKYPLTAMLTETATKEKMSMCLQRVLTSAEQNHQKQAKKILQKPLTAKKNLINRRKTK